MISEVLDGTLRPRAIWPRGTGRRATRRSPSSARAAPLEYPLIEEEVARRQAATRSTSRRRLAHAAALARPARLGAYVVAALTVDGTTAGCSTPTPTPAAGRSTSSIARSSARYCEGLAGVFERAVLRETLQPAPQRAAVGGRSG